MDSSIVSFVCPYPGCIDPFVYRSHTRNKNLDPIGQHIIALREWNEKLKSWLEKYNEELVKLQKNHDVSGSECDIKEIDLIPPCPEVPKSKNSHNTNLQDVPNGTIDTLQQCFVKSVCAQSGYSIIKEEVAKELVTVNEMFLRRLIQYLKQAKQESSNQEDKMMDEDKKTMALLDFSLQRIGIGGIKGLNDFYQARVSLQENLNKSCERLHSACKQKQTELENLLSSESA